MTSMLRSSGVALTLTLLASLGCKPKPCETDLPLPLQVLTVADEKVNLGDDGQGWPVSYYVFELSSEPPEVALGSPEALADDHGSLGEALVKAHERTAYPDGSESWSIKLDPKTEVVLIVALFRRVVGESWYQLYSVPKEHHQRVCEAARKKRTVPDPCFFLLFEGYEVRGGPFPPPGFDVSIFRTACAPVVASAEGRPGRQTH